MIPDSSHCRRYEDFWHVNAAQNRTWAKESVPGHRPGYVRFARRKLLKFGAALVYSAFRDITGQNLPHDPAAWKKLLQLRGQTLGAGERDKE
jgi:hypothetical protein